ncbi:(3S)-malyl-CoA thioesterase [Cereibacter azotoformans]|uniref:(3S)-malyl-CoA thioesterase n=1 Tax=Cereibacter azotoformans TaxID=43057 RepID=A0A2T5KE79_9RHOB|nr:(3S)-malyl-CoA thioesterase [Cereibacter azotoformans]AXQ92408.1 CoA ester lyase [Cereibacter sphaeroides]MBO4170023.1 (3S)-malyl-CoA thioesterase [Cereibacter azotoformans]PTR20714.1 (3S)-malyl-CoA thioesterase [Cereibacter azotoformans]UIJ30679.1 (3S)-malyl-CoA thioesterase [Cereibacter azotoformans]
MAHQAHPFRSVLYIPGSKERALEKAQGLAADAIIFDLEDAVAHDEKIHARDLLRKTLETADYGRRIRIVRVNGMDTEWGRDDVAAFAGSKADVILIPKVSSAAHVQAVADLIPDVPLWAMMETALGMLNAAEIAAHPRLTGMVMGTNDLAKELTSRFRPDRLALQTGLGLCLLAARAHGLTIVDGVYNAFKDEDGLRAECEQGRDMGFDGKTLIHPAQLEIANEVFSPSSAEIELANRQIAAFEEAERHGQGVAVVDGKIVENLHIVTARQTLAKAEAIAAFGAS